MARKKCTRCGEKKELDTHFKKNKHSIDGHYHICNSCFQQAMDERKAAVSGSKPKVVQLVGPAKTPPEPQNSNDLFREAIAMMAQAINLMSKALAA